MKNGSGRGFIGEPTQTLCTELAGDNTVISKEAWMRDGENVEEMDTGIFDHNPHDPNYHHIELENLENIGDDSAYDNTEATPRWNNSCKDGSMARPIGLGKRFSIATGAAFSLPRFKTCRMSDVRQLDGVPRPK
ncbi:MAG: hypothetical protein COV90_02265 [Candidatus Tagabacteria bacterium CG11_big_fil_rev_8_21_14_0_20_41_11]|nr:MAG: hypothetical protein COV90_02265 [Candidatus Tagabacteria bacterium CG11_big_fil_rev_8_21_14_0_20_41_11]